MSNKHSPGPCCPFCPKRRFRDQGALEDHQRAVGHFPNRDTPAAAEEKRARAQLEAYHREKKAGRA